MQLGLIGLPMSGKTTIYNALTGAEGPVGRGGAGRLEVELAVVSVPDPRLDALYEMFQPPKKVQAQITYSDFGGLDKGISQGGLAGPLRNELAKIDACLHVLRAFEHENVPHPEGSVDPLRDFETLNGEFLLVDLITVEKRVERLRDEMSKGKNREANARELMLFERLGEALEAEISLRELPFTPAEAVALRGYRFLTMKPQMVLLNIGDDDPEPTEALAALAEKCPALCIRGALEMEIARLDDEEAEAFMSEYGIGQPARERIISESYGLLDLLTFYTIGDDEVRAWPVPVGVSAQEASGQIHSDIARGFIRAEIIPFETLVELGGLAEARSAGKLRLEGKDYVLQDGEIMTVRFSV
jgi:GTP-binding protein YchF